MNAKKPTVEELQSELSEVWARLERHSLMLEQLEQSVEDARRAAGDAYMWADEAHERINEIE